MPAGHLLSNLRLKALSVVKSWKYRLDWVKQSVVTKTAVGTEEAHTILHLFPLFLFLLVIQMKIKKKEADQILEIENYCLPDLSSKVNYFF